MGTLAGSSSADKQGTSNEDPDHRSRRLLASARRIQQTYKWGQSTFVVREKLNFKIPELLHTWHKKICNLIQCLRLTLFWPLDLPLISNICLFSSPPSPQDLS